MKFSKALIIAGFVVPGVSGAWADDFSMASDLLVAAKNANLQQVQSLIRQGANINYVDNTGLSLVCTAIKNNDMRTAKILQMYGADASNCDRQIKNYNSRNTPEETGGLFSGLTKTQGLVLAGVGSAAVVGGLLWLTDTFSPDNGNGGGGSSSGGNNNNNNNNNNTNTSGTGLFGTNGLPYGPAVVNAAGERDTYPENLKLYYLQEITGASGTDPVPNTPNYENFVLMNANQNYLLLMHGYSAFARGYFGMRTLRDLQTNVPLLSYKQYELGTEPVMGGRPVNVALVTTNGINAAADTSLADKFLVWTTNSGNSSVNDASNYNISSKYYNNRITLDDQNGDLGNDTTAEERGLLSSFDLSNSGTAIHNSLALGTENLIAKTVGGLDSAIGDFVGFMPNGQMTIYRTGGGHAFSELETPVYAGTYTGDAIATGNLLENFLGSTWDIAMDGNGLTLTSTTDTAKKLYGYIGTDGLMYLDLLGANGLTGTDNVVDTAYIISSGVLTKKSVLTDTDYYNYTALANAITKQTDLGIGGDILNLGRSHVDIIANTSVIEPLHARDAGTIADVLAVPASAYSTRFLNLIATSYGNSSTDNSLLPTVAATSFFNSLSTYPTLTLFSTGGSIQNTGVNYLDAVQTASFENAAPLVVSNLEHLFMSIVPVGAITTGVEQITPNSDAMPALSGAKYQLAQWADGLNNYKARACGVAGTGANGIDPWCFAAVGLNDELAVASAAGAAGVLKSAFYYMTPQQIFTLLALTADGPFLKAKSGSNGNYSQEELIAHLTGMYEMPAEYQFRITNGENYLDVFKEVFGYGVINLERATKPGTNVYYFTNNKIVSANGNSYWGTVSTTNLRGSSVFNLGRGASISVAAYDVLESIDGTMSLPRIWESNVMLGNADRHGLYMGDVLGDLKTRDMDDDTTSVGDLKFTLARTERAYADNMNGLDNMRLEYGFGNWRFGADYQHYLTDGKSRFFDSNNPILSLASNAITTDTTYNYGKWSFGARAFSAAMTDEGLLQNDPVVSSTYEPMKLGTMNGAQSAIAWNGEKFGMGAAFGFAHESDTLLGAYSSGFLETNGADTRYIDMTAFWTPTDDITLDFRATFAHTETNGLNDGMIGLTDLDSNAFAVNARFGHLSFGASLPLAVYNGVLSYNDIDYEIVDGDNGRYELQITDNGYKNINVAPERREVRFTATYKHNFGEFTDGALGFVYRVNPNHTDEFGNESIFMMKMTHRLGI